MLFHATNALWVGEAVRVENGTKDGKNGADWWLQCHKILPEYYNTEEERKVLEWR